MPKQKYKVLKTDIPNKFMSYKLALVNEDGQLINGSTLCYSPTRPRLDAIKLALDFTATTLRTGDELKLTVYASHSSIARILFNDDEDD